MTNADRTSTGRPGARKRAGWAARAAVLGAMAASALLLSVSVANATSHDSNRYEPKEAGHPLRIAAYVLHPVGVILDRLIMRPAYWLGSLEPIKTLVGRED